MGRKVIGSDAAGAAYVPLRPIYPPYDLIATLLYGSRVQISEVIPKRQTRYRHWMHMRAQAIVLLP